MNKFQQVIETETIDKLFLELSQITKAKTQRQLRYEVLLFRCIKALEIVPANVRNGEHIALPDQIRKAIEE